MAYSFRSLKIKNIEHKKQKSPRSYGDFVDKIE
jgi:hypothetical protein